MATTKFDVTVQPVTSPEDFLTYQEVSTAAFKPSEMMGLIFPSHNRPSAEAAEATRKNLEDSWRNDKSVYFSTAKLSTGKIVGIAKWHFFLDLGPHCVYPKKFPPGGNAELGALFFRSLEEKRDAVLAGKKYALMAVLAIDPAYQRMGIGKKLLDWGLAKCDEEGWECWIDATKNGKGLYEKCGWELVEDKHFDLEKYGGAKGATDTCSCMLRQPQSQG